MNDSVIFKNAAGQERQIAAIDGQTDYDRLREAMLQIRAFCAERNFTIYCTRMWNSNGRTVFDVGSHTEFFYLDPEVNEVNINCESGCKNVDEQP